MAGPGDAARRSTFPAGAALVDGDVAWVLIDQRPGRALGPALAWADRAGVTTLHVLVDDDSAGALARQALAFTPSPSVWQIRGRQLVAAGPAPYPPAREPAAEALAAAQVLRDGDVEVVVEHGQVLGEILGLEIARVVVDEHGARIEVGVGRHDREAFAMLHGDLPAPAALASVADTVRRHRRAGASPHPLGRLAAERWLRRRLMDDPSLVDAVVLEPVETSVPRASVKDAAPAAAVGIDAAGEQVVVVCSTGIDLDLVPTAADVRVGHAPGARLVLVVPERDDHPVTRALAATLVRPAEIVVLPGDGRG